MFEGNQSVSGQDGGETGKDLIWEIQSTNEEAKNSRVSANDCVENRKREQPSNGQKARDHGSHDSECKEKQPPTERKPVLIFWHMKK